MGCAFFAGFVNFCGDVSARALAAHGSVVILMERSDRKNRSCRRYGLCGLRAWDSFAALRMTETAGQNDKERRGRKTGNRMTALFVIPRERSDRENRSCRRYGLCGLRAWDSFATLRMTETAGQNNRNGGAERSLRCSAFAESKPVIKSFDK